MEEYRLIAYRHVYLLNFAVTGARRVRQSVRLWVCRNGVWGWL
ncbi:MAG: hypothetical protein WC279_12235 [Sulfurimonas sp.]|jgi:hypothetical protein